VNTDLSPKPRPLGRTDLVVGPIAYGCWRFAGTDVPSARTKIETALEVGMTLFDTADIYGIDDGHPVGAAEALLGEVLTAVPGLRERMVIATKSGIVPGVPYDSSAVHLRRACEASLRRLRVDRIDLYQIHRPDLLSHPEETAATLEALRREGKIGEVGVSNFTAAQFESLQAYLPFPIATHQPELSAWCVEPLWDGVLDQCLRERVTPLAWSPLGGGRVGDDLELAGSDRLHDCLDGIAREQGVSRAAVALAFLLAHPAGIVPIVGTQRPDRIRDALAAFRVTLDRSGWYTILQASLGEPLP
jgi:predicted oxidoreductase